jgi:hypothetical protein
VEARLLIAYALIVLMIAATIAGALYVHHNSPSQRRSRERRRDKAAYESRLGK